MELCSFSLGAATPATVADIWAEVADIISADAHTSAVKPLQAYVATNIKPATSHEIATAADRVNWKTSNKWNCNS